MKLHSILVGLLACFTLASCQEELKVQLSTKDDAVKFDGVVGEYISIAPGTYDMKFAKIDGKDAFSFDMDLTLNITPEAKKVDLRVWDLALTVADEQGNSLMDLKVANKAAEQEAWHLKEAFKSNASMAPWPMT